MRLLSVATAAMCAAPQEPHVTARDASGSYAPSTSVALLTGDWGLTREPRVRAYYTRPFSRPAAHTTVVGGAELLLIFDMATNRGGSAVGQPISKQQLELILASSPPIGHEFSGAWLSDAALKITVTNAGSIELSLREASLARGRRRDGAAALVHTPPVTAAIVTAAHLIPTALPSMRSASLIAPLARRALASRECARTRQRSFLSWRRQRRRLVAAGSQQARHLARLDRTYTCDLRPRLHPRDRLDRCGRRLAWRQRRLRRRSHVTFDAATFDAALATTQVQ